MQVRSSDAPLRCRRVRARRPSALDHTCGAFRAPRRAEERAGRTHEGASQARCARSGRFAWRRSGPDRVRLRATLWEDGRAPRPGGGLGRHLERGTAESLAGRRAESEQWSPAAMPKHRTRSHPADRPDTREPGSGTARRTRRDPTGRHSSPADSHSCPARSILRSRPSESRAGTWRPRRLRRSTPKALRARRARPRPGSDTSSL